MLEKALYVYIRGYHPANFKKLFNNFWGAYSTSYLLIIAPIMNFDKIIFSSVGNALLYYILVLTTMIAMSNNALVPLTLQKQMFLCPMQEKDRKDYIKALLVVKLVFPFSIMLVLLMGLAVIFQKDLLMLANVLIATVSLTITLILQPEGDRERRTGQAEKNSWIAKVWYVVNMLVAAMHLLLSVLAILDEEPFSFGLWVYFTVSVTVQLLINIYIIKRNVPIIIEGAMDYETCMRLLENLNKNSNRKK